METGVIVVLSLLCVILIFILMIQKKDYSGANKKIKKTVKMCPLCGSLLVYDEDCVIGEFANIDGKKKIYIYGCNYCLRGKRHGKRISL